MSTLTSRRLVAEVPYITSPGVRVRAFVTDLGVFEKQDDGVLGLVAVAPGAGTVDERVEAIRERCPWDLAVSDDLVELDPPDPDAHRAPPALGPAGTLPPSRRLNHRRPRPDTDDRVPRTPTAHELGTVPNSERP